MQVRHTCVVGVDMYGLLASGHKPLSPESRHRRYIYISQISIYTISVGLAHCARSPISL